MDLTKLSEVELKALGFEQMTLLQQTQQNLAFIQQELAGRAKPKEFEPAVKSKK